MQANLIICNNSFLIQLKLHKNCQERSVLKKQRKKNFTMTLKIWTRHLKIYLWIQSVKNQQKAKRGVLKTQLQARSLFVGWKSIFACLRNQIISVLTTFCVIAKSICILNFYVHLTLVLAKAICSQITKSYTIKKTCNLSIDLVTVSFSISKFVLSTKKKVSTS